MKLRNTSRFSNEVVRWAVGVAHAVLAGDLSLAGVRVWTRNRSRGSTSGRAFPRSRRIVASVGPDSGFPRTYTYRKSVPDQVLNDAIEGLCSILAHELQHVVQGQSRHAGADEVQCELVAAQAVRLCRERRTEVDALLEAEAEAKAVAVAAPVDSQARIAAMAAGRSKAADARLTRLRANVERWEAKLARAQRALKKLRPKLRASEKRAAARGST